MLWILEHPCDSWTCQESRPLVTASHGQGPARFLCFWISMQKANVVSGWECRQPGFAPYCSKVCWGRWASQYVRTEKTCSEFLSSRDHTQPSRLSFALAVILTMNTRRYQQASKDIGMGVADLAPICKSEPVMAAVFSAVVGSARVLHAGSDLECRSSDVS